MKIILLNNEKGEKMQENTVLVENEQMEPWQRLDQALSAVTRMRLWKEDLENYNKLSDFIKENQ